MFKFIIQAPTLDEAELKVSQLLNRLRKSDIVAIQDPSELDQQYVSESEISNVHQMHQPREVLASPALAAPAQVAVNLNEVDNRGVPWIAGIHTSKKTFMKNGNWKAARGTTDAQVDSAEAPYLKQVTEKYFTPPVAPVTPSYTPPVQHPAPVQNPVQQHVVTPPVQQAPMMPPMAMPTGHTVQTFTQNFPLIMSQLITEGEVSEAYIKQINDYCGVTQIWLINDTQKAELFETFVANNIITKVG